MYVLDPDAVRRLDQATIEAGTPSLQLMERAGEGIARSILERPARLEGTVLVFCGKGNNGGDGLVVARLLHEHGHRVCALCVAGPRTADAQANFDRASSVGVELLEVDATGDDLVRALRGACAARPGRLVIDALLGTGFRPPLREDLARWCEAIADLDRFVLAIDGPSGLDGATGEVAAQTPMASRTITLGAMKWGLIEPRGRKHAGRLEIVDLGFEEALDVARFDELCPAGPRRARWIDAEWVRRQLGAVEFDAHKYSRGTVAVVGASEGMSGAVTLACQGALRAGAGLVEARVPGSEKSVVDAQCVETLVRGGDCDPSALRELASRRQALVLGPGAGRDDARVAELIAFLHDYRGNAPLVVDADALYAIASSPYAMRGPCVFTPHTGELARLLDVDSEEILRERMHFVREAARRYRAVIVHKGAPTVVATAEGEALVIGAGGPGLATAGSGDVLAGVIGALLAAGLEATVAAAAGAWIHGAAGDRGEARLGTRGLIASDLPPLVAAVLRDLEERGS